MSEALRILLVHNAYQQRGGEDAVVDSEQALLLAHGHPVHRLARHNDELRSLGMVSAAVQTVWSARTVEELGREIRVFGPDVIHVHNTFPLVSPSLFWAASRVGVPVVQTLHNFRLMCPQAMFLRDGKVCEDCLGHVPWRAVTRRCYRGSVAQSGVLAGMLVGHRLLGTWTDKVTRYIALNEFCRQKFIAGGLPADRIVVKPNFVDASAPQEVERRGFLFVGRLSQEKGVATLAEACRKTGFATRIAGQGPDATIFEGVAGLELLGALDSKQVLREMASAQALVLPSICYENFPRTVVEAFASRLPVIASGFGSMAEIVEDGVTGLLFRPGDAQDLADKLRWAAAHPEEMAAMGRTARARYEAHYGAEENYRQLLAIYRAAITEVTGQTT